MTAPRTVTVPTLDHGDIAIPEPAWCTGHVGLRPEARVDISHRGPEHDIGLPAEPLFVAMLSQYPHSNRPETGLYVETYDLSRTRSPAEVDQLAASLVEAAAQLRALARRLAAIRAGGAL
ncbi:DUF6907 domain-containing protein [Streptomyces sp. NPDC002889]|uniref:DUF6907 domain-containing protein n=1 Tax=Streptomyces sp. NPDC002889 TaxID=3364669 RepID=UPI0036C8E06B